MELLSPNFGLISFFLLLYFYRLLSNAFYSKTKLPPQADGARPVLGHLHLLGGGGSSSSAHPPDINLGSKADQHGPIFTIRVGARRVLVVSSWKIAKELFTTCDIAVSSRPKLRSTKHMSNDLAMFGFAPYGAYWRELRKLVSIELLSSRRVEMLSRVCVSEIGQSIRELYTLWEEKKDGSGWLVVDLKKWFGELNLNMIMRLVAGKRFGNDDGEEMRWCREVVTDFFHLLGIFVAADSLPWLGWFDLGGYEKRMKETARKMDSVIGGWLEVHHRQHKEDSGGDRVQDFMDTMISTVRNLEFRGQFDTDTIIKSTCQTMILAGSDTSSVTLTWVLSLLLNNRNTLAKAQAELDRHVGRERRVKESDITNLQYLQCIVKETLRLYPSGPLGTTREFTQDCNVAGYYVPKGTWLMVNIWKLQRDPEVWPEKPTEFNPDRFITIHQNVDVKGKNFELIPFGAGRRMCPGLNLGLHMVHLTLANLLQAFDVRTISDEAVDMTESVGLTNPKATPLEVLIAPRLPPNLY